MITGGCDFHDTLNAACVHCLGNELALARAEAKRLTEWIAHLTKNERSAWILLAQCRDWFDNPDGEPDSSDIVDRINAVMGAPPPYGSPTPGHVGWHKWKNGAELVWVCSRGCPHPSHEDYEP